MNASTVNKAPSLYVDYIRDQLKVKFGPSMPALYNHHIVGDIVSAFHGFKSFEAFQRAINSFNEFDPYRLETYKTLKTQLLNSGFINVYKYLTNFYKNSRIGQESIDGKSIPISDDIAEKVAEFVCEIHSFENLTFIDILDVKHSLSIKYPMYARKEAPTFFEILDYYSASFIIRSIKLKRAEHVSHTVKEEHCHIDIHNVFVDVYGFFDLSSYYCFMKVFRKIVYKDGTRLTGKHANEAMPYPSNKDRNNVKGLSNRDWRDLCDLVDIATTQGHLSLSRFLFRFYKHPKASDKNELREDLTEYEDFLGARNSTGTTHSVAV